MVMERRGVIFLEDVREWKLPGLLYADDLVLCVEMEESVMVMNGEEGLGANVRRVAGAIRSLVNAKDLQL